MVQFSQQLAFFSAFGICFSILYFLVQTVQTSWHSEFSSAILKTSYTLLLTWQSVFFGTSFSAIVKTSTNFLEILKY